MAGTADAPVQGEAPQPEEESIFHRVLSRWRRLTTGSVNRRVLGATLVVGSMTIIIKAISLLKESFVAASFGTGGDYDAFIVALLLPSTIVGILSGSLNAALIPTYIEIRDKENKEAAQRLYTTILLWNTILLGGLTLLMAWTVRLWLPFIAWGFDPAKLELTRTIALWSLPLVLLTGFATTWGAILNAGERFALVAIAPALQPLAIILGLSFFCRAWGIYALLFGTVLGVLLETVVLGMALARKGHPLLPRWHGVTTAFRKVRAQYGACIAAAFLVNGMGLVDQAFASTLGPRSNSALSYGSKLVGLVLTLGGTALGTAILPQLSRMVANNNWTGIRRFLRQYTALILAVAVPTTVILILLSTFIVRTMFQNGSFNASDTALVVRIQIFYLLRIPFSACGILVTRTLTALRANHFLMWTAVVSFTINAALDYLFIQTYGIAGITLSTSVCSCIIFLGASYAMYRLLDRRALESPAA
ncbi:murein biosynthesis integral membrane protein MurJ [Geothrix sp. 21YS21S-2]|uniref:murein biosynthesis integral membrane protein MurJ n=1 Tax=Geothrix sp. 21YS21S-2 TaxID=3068893 RepID=UPI0027B91A91|nr:lipid II flippase MurJ [Geothrix sp. 21YS21S-2]